MKLSSNLDHIEDENREISVQMFKKEDQAIIVESYLDTEELKKVSIMVEGEDNFEAIKKEMLEFINDGEEIEGVEIVHINKRYES